MVVAPGLEIKATDLETRARRGERKWGEVRGQHNCCRGPLSAYAQRQKRGRRAREQILLGRRHVLGEW